MQKTGNAAYSAAAVALPPEWKPVAVEPAKSKLNGFECTRFRFEGEAGYLESWIADSRKVVLKEEYEESGQRESWTLTHIETLTDVDANYFEIPPGYSVQEQ